MPLTHTSGFPIDKATVASPGAPAPLGQKRGGYAQDPVRSKVSR